MTVLVSIAFLVLTAAVVFLFAIVGELASRIPDADSAGAGHATALEDFHHGARAASWPAVLPGADEGRRTVLFVLSTACSTCNLVAAELVEHPSRDVGGRLGLVVVSPTVSIGEEFIDQQNLHDVPHFVDEGGQWVAGNFGVTLSPAALVFEDGELVRAFTFSSVTLLRDRIDSVKEGAR